MNRSEITDAIRRLSRDVRAMQMVGPNPIAPNCPQRGAYGVSQWARTTKHLKWKTAPEGWDTLAAREDAGEEITPFVVIWKGDDGFCVSLDSDCAVALYAAPSQREIEEIAEWITDEYEEASGW